MPWTTEQVLALAPDASSRQSGKGLAAPRKWLTLGTDGQSVWGTLQGSGKEPYRTSIDLGGPAFKCSCPSRKFPCKHGLGLFLILAQQPGALDETAPPPWTTEWLARRAEKEEKRSAPPSSTEATEAPPDPAAQAKATADASRRAATRDARIEAGLADLGTWLEDLVRTGFAALPGKPSSFWETPAARLVDAQAPGLARRVRELDGITARGEAWPDRLLRELALLHLAREGWRHLDGLPPPVREDLRAWVGIPSRQEDILAEPGVRDRWCVLGQRVEDDGRIRTQRTWLLGHDTRRAALCLSFSAGPTQPLDASLVPGSAFDADLVFFPGAWPLRALVKARHGPPDFAPPLFPHDSTEVAVAAGAEAFTANPWLDRIPVALSSVTPLPRAGTWVLRDGSGGVLDLDVSESAAWILRAISGGRPLALAGEWNGERLSPLGAWAGNRYVRLAT